MTILLSALHVLKPKNMSSCVQATQVPIRAFVCTLQERFLLSAAFPIVSIAVWVTTFARFDRCLNVFQSTARHWDRALGLNYFVFETFYLLPFLASASRESKGPFDWMYLLEDSINRSNIWARGNAEFIVCFFYMCLNTIFLSGRKSCITLMFMK